MGEIKKQFCDGCKAEYTPATYSKGDESGSVEQHMAVWKKTGLEIDGAKADMCPTCYTKMLTWLKGKKTAAATAFEIENPDVEAFTPPNL